MSGGLFLLCVLLAAFVGAFVGAAFKRRDSRDPAISLEKIARIVPMTRELTRDEPPIIPQPRPRNGDAYHAGIKEGLRLASDNAEYNRCHYCADAIRAIALRLKP